MSVQTRQQKRTEALTHIVEELLEAKGQPIETFFKAYGFTNPNNLNTTPGTDIKDFEFKDAAGVDKKLTPLDVNKIRVFQGYIRYRDALLNPIGDDDWSKITLAQLDAFRASVYCDPSETMCLKQGTTAELAAMAANVAPASTTGTNTTTATPTHGELHEFCKGIK